MLVSVSSWFGWVVFTSFEVFLSLVLALVRQVDLGNGIAYERIMLNNEASRIRWLN